MLLKQAQLLVDNKRLTDHNIGEHGDVGSGDDHSGDNNDYGDDYTNGYVDHYDKKTVCIFYFKSNSDSD